MRLLFATKDVGGFQATEPIARVSKARGHTPIILAEGLSVQEWRNKNWELTFEGTKDFEKEPFDFDPKLAIEAAQLGAVIVTYGAPPNIEAKLAHAAAELKVPLIGIEDYIGGSRRINPGIFDLILTKEFGREAIATLSPGIKAKIVEIGSVFIASMLQTPIPSKIVEIFNRACGGRRAVLVAGNGHDTQYFLHWTLASAGISSEKVIVIVRHHPRTRGTEKDKEMWMLQQKLYAALKGDKAITMLPEIADTRFIARLADATVSNYGTLFEASAVGGHIPVRVSSPVCDAELLSESKLDFHPMVRVGKHEIGAALEFNWECPADLLAKVFSQRDKVVAAQRANFKFSRTAPEDAMNEIEKLAKSR